MDLSLTPEQDLLVATASDFVARSVDPQVVRSLEAGTAGHDRDLWATMAELGWTELGPIELALVAERLGRGPVPSPLVVTGALRAALPGLAAGLPADAVVTLAVLTPGAAHEWADPVAVTGDTLTGTFLLVPFASSAEVVVVVTDSGLAAFDLPASGVVLRRHDAVGGDPLYRLECSAVPVRRVAGDRGTVLDHLAVTGLAYAVGAAEGALALSVRHAKDRRQFGRPIGSFQAVSHRCAEMRAEVDACRVLALRAAWALDHDDDTELAIASALSYANDALRRIAMHAHQVHGAIGFSTECDLHLYTRRIKAYELGYGSTARHQDRLASAIGLQ